MAHPSGNDASRLPRRVARWAAEWEAQDGDPGPGAVIASARATHTDLDAARVEQAWRVAARSHADQRRASGEPYIVHPLAVAEIVADFGLDEDAIVAAILHDTVEDTPVTSADLKRLFGAEVARLVDGVTKLDQVRGRSKEATEGETLRKMLVALATDLRVLVIKLCDRLHNVRTLGAVSEDRQRATARETLDVFVPLAHRLGMYRLALELEDHCFAILMPQQYAELARMVAEAAPRRGETLDVVLDEIRERLDDASIPAAIEGRTKSLWSVFNKAQVRGVPFEQIADLVGVRVITETVKDCYAALGEIHQLYTPIPGKLSDFIAAPKWNLYQSLHTKVMGPDGQTIEVQVRTSQMHRRAETGVASHYLYKAAADARGDRLPWVQRLMERHAEATDPTEFLDALRSDLVRGEVFVFTPDGETVALPTGSTPIDFAYAIHTEIGHRCVGAKVNGQLRSLRSPLHVGDQVEIVVDPEGPGPSADWLDVVATARARQLIRQSLSKSRRAQAREAGRRALAVLSADEQRRAAERLDRRDVSALELAVGRGEVKLGTVLTAAGVDGATPRAEGPAVAGETLRPSADGMRRVVLQLEAVDRPALLADVARVLADCGVDLVAVVTVTGDDGTAVQRFTFDLADAEHLGAVVAQVEQVDSVFRVGQQPDT